MQVALYIATHNTTKKKYFGKTTRYLTEEALQKNYHGSGVMWVEHLKDFGDDVSMKLLGVYSIDTVSAIAIKFSNDNNIVASNDWLNMVIEDGLYGGSIKGAKRKKDRQCGFCLKFVYPSERMYHFEYCNDNPNRKSREIACTFCARVFKDSTGMLNHALVCNDNPNRLKYRCTYCTKEYSDRRNCIQHEDTCALNPDKSTYYCKHCKKQQATKGSLAKHETICIDNPERADEVYVCKFCGAKFKNAKINLINHEKHYCNGNPEAHKKHYKCECGRVFTDAGNYTQHTRKCNG